MIHAIVASPITAARMNRAARLIRRSFRARDHWGKVPGDASRAHEKPCKLRCFATPEFRQTLLVELLPDLCVGEAVGDQP